MGYRIDITNEDGTIWYYGTKHYGYSFFWLDEGLKYPSVKYLYDLGKVGREKRIICWDYGCDNNITLTAKEFKKFIKLYAKEIDDMQMKATHTHYYLLEDKDIKALLKDKGDKKIEWC